MTNDFFLKSIFQGKSKVKWLKLKEILSKKVKIGFGFDPGDKWNLRYCIFNGSQCVKANNRASPVLA